MTNQVIPEAAVEAATRTLHANSADRWANSIPWEDLTNEQIATFRTETRAILNAAAPHMLVDTRVVSEDRKVDIYRTSDRPGVNHAQVTISSLEDLEAICSKHETEAVITVGKNGRLSAVEIVDDYRE